MLLPLSHNICSIMQPIFLQNRIYIYLSTERDSFKISVQLSAVDNTGSFRTGHTSFKEVDPEVLVEDVRRKDKTSPQLDPKHCPEGALSPNCDEARTRHIPLWSYLFLSFSWARHD